MTVEELIEHLEKQDPGRIVVMSKDGEGNGFSPLDRFSTHAYEAETTWSGEIGLERLTDDLKSAGYEEEDVLENGEPALVLWPVN